MNDEWLHYPDVYDGPWNGEGDWMKFTETTCTVGMAWIGKTDDPRLQALMEWLEFHGIEDPANTVACSTWTNGVLTLHPIERILDRCQVRYTRRENPTIPAVSQGEAPPLPWPSILWTPVGYRLGDQSSPEVGGKETDHERTAHSPDAHGHQWRRLGVADDHPDRAGDHRPAHLHLPHGDRAALAPVILDALGDSPAIGGRG